MNQPLVISPKRCEGLAWNPPTDYQFASQQSLVPLHAGELTKAASTLPLALHKQEGQWRLVAVCGLEKSRNLFVRQGKWLGQYKPEWLQSWPFYSLTVGDKSIAVFDRDSGLLAEQGEPFFDANGKPESATRAVLASLKSTAPKHQLTTKAVNALMEAGVVSPWPETLFKQTGMSQDGLCCIDEKALAQLDDETFLNLRHQNALVVAYGVNFSLQQVHLLTRLSLLNPHSESEVTEELDDVFDDDELTLDFDA